MKKLVSLFLITTIISCLFSKPSNLFANDTSSKESEIQAINDKYGLTTTFVDLEDIDSTKAIVFETTQEYEEFLAHIQSNQPIIFQDATMPNTPLLHNSISYSSSRQGYDGWITDGQTHLSDVGQYQPVSTLPFIINCVFKFTPSYYFYSDKFRFDSISDIKTYVSGFQLGLNATWEEQASNYVFSSDKSQVTIEVVGTRSNYLVVQGIGQLMTSTYSPKFYYTARYWYNI